MGPIAIRVVTPIFVIPAASLCYGARRRWRDTDMADWIGSHSSSRQARIGLVRYLTASLFVGVTFVILDALLNANPVAQAAYAPLASVARREINVLAGVAIDLVYGFVLCAIFIWIQGPLPGNSTLL